MGIICGREAQRKHLLSGYFEKMKCTVDDTLRTLWKLKEEKNGDFPPRVSFGSHHLLTILSCTPRVFMNGFAPSSLGTASLPSSVAPGRHMILEPSSLTKTHPCESRFLSLLYDLCMLSSFQHLPNSTSLATVDSMEPTCDGRPQIYLPV